jgi:hypothetical protein
MTNEWAKRRVHHRRRRRAARGVSAPDVSGGNVLFYRHFHVRTARITVVTAQGGAQRVTHSIENIISETF